VADFPGDSLTRAASDWRVLRLPPPGTRHSAEFFSVRFLEKRRCFAIFPEQIMYGDKSEGKRYAPNAVF
jgi:hypothetical protein